MVSFGKIDLIVFNCHFDLFPNLAFGLIDHYLNETKIL